MKRSVRWLAPVCYLWVVLSVSNSAFSEPSAVVAEQKVRSFAGVLEREVMNRGRVQYVFFLRTEKGERYQLSLPSHYEGVAHLLRNRKVSLRALLKRKPSPQLKRPGLLKVKNLARYRHLG